MALLPRVAVAPQNPDVSPVDVRLLLIAAAAEDFRRAVRVIESDPDSRKLLIGQGFHQCRRKEGETTPLPPVKFVQNEPEKLLKIKENARKNGAKRT